LEELLTKYRDILGEKSDGYRQTNRVYLSIDTAEAKLIRQPPRRLPLAI
jgi:hypothetical protein